MKLQLICYLMPKRNSFSNEYVNQGHRIIFDFHESLFSLVSWTRMEYAAIDNNTLCQ